MLESIIVGITISSGLLVIYHHLGYPLILRFLRRHKTSFLPTLHQRHYQPEPQDRLLPTITLVMPAYNEQRWIADKIRNLSALDYPADRLAIIIACDGCSDATATIARQVAREAECRHLQIQVEEYQQNVGKVAVINRTMAQVDSELVGLSDISALISVDALLIAAKHFMNPTIGVVNSHYQLLNPGSEGEAAYWRYQSRVKSAEAALGSVLGAHGAFYLFRRDLFHQLAADTINDDFMLPMEIVAQGYRAEQVENITSLELERADSSIEKHRRQRIAAGNLQQLLRLKHLLMPRYRQLAFSFASGKGLRVVMPLLMLLSLSGSLWLAVNSIAWALLAGLQSSGYLLAGWQIRHQQPNCNRLQRTLAYLVSAHLASLSGSLRYLRGNHQGRWH